MGTESLSTSGNRANRALLSAKNGIREVVTNPVERRRFLKFMVVGAVGAIVDFGVFNLLVAFTDILAVFASMISFTAAVCSNFLWNRLWTYPDSRSKPVSRQLVQFFVVNVVGLLIRTPLFAFLERALIPTFASILPAGFPLTPTFLGHNISLAFAVGVVMLWNFFINRYWTYNDVT